MFLVEVMHVAVDVVIEDHIAVVSGNVLDDLVGNDEQHNNEGNEIIGCIIFLDRGDVVVCAMNQYRDKDGKKTEQF